MGIWLLFFGGKGGSGGDKEYLWGVKEWLWGVKEFLWGVKEFLWGVKELKGVIARYAR